MSISIPDAMPHPSRRLLLVCASGALAIGAGMAVDPKFALALSGGLIAAATGFLCSPLLLFAFYYGISQFTAAVHLPGVAVSLNQALFLMVFAGWARWAFTRRLMLPRGWPLALVLALAAFLTASALTGYSADLGHIAAKTVVTLAAISLAIAAAIRSPARIRKLAWAILLPTVANGLVAVAEALVNHDIFGQRPDYFHGLFRINGVAPNSIVFAHICLFALPFALYLMRHSPCRWQRALAVGAGIFLLLVTARTFNRQSLLLMPILILAAACLFRGQLGRWLLFGTVAGMLVAGPLILPTALARLQTLGQAQTDMSFRIRRDNMLNALQLVKIDPWFGAGLGSFPDAWWSVRTFHTYYNQYEEVPRKQEVDMSYIRLAAETGWLGLALNLAIYVALAGCIWSCRRRFLRAEEMPRQAHSAWLDFANVLLLSWLFFLLASAMQDTILYLRTWLLFALSAGMYWKMRGA